MRVDRCKESAINPKSGTASEHDRAPVRSRRRIPAAFARGLWGQPYKDELRFKLAFIPRMTCGNVRMLENLIWFDLDFVYSGP